MKANKVGGMRIAPHLLVDQLPLQKLILRYVAFAALLVAGPLITSCATLNELARVISAPRFEQDRDRPTELRLVGPSASRGLGGAAVRIWTRVSNPNAFGIELRRLEGDLYLDERHAATADFPLGQSLAARDEIVVPLDLAISFADVPGLGPVITRALSGDTLPFRLDGRVTIEAGPLGQPSFGPATLLRGEIQTRR